MLKLQKKLSNSQQYTPSEDTFFLADYVKHEKGNIALDIGTGSGYLAKVLSQNFSQVVASDIDFNSLRFQTNKIKLLCCNAADALYTKFDLIICNMPYLPSSEILDRTVDGGKEGLEIPLSILKSSRARLKNTGKIIFLTSSLSNVEKLLEEIKKFGFSCRKVSQKKLFFEELIIVEAKLI